MKPKILKCLMSLIGILYLEFTSFGINPVYVSPKGNDSADGSFAHPYLTIEKARDDIRIKRSSEENGVCSILLRGGDYYFARTVNFEKPDKDLLIAPYKNEKVRFTGGISIESRNYHPLRESKIVMEIRR